MRPELPRSLPALLGKGHFQTKQWAPAPGVTFDLDECM